MNDVISDIISQIDNIRKKRLEAEQLINNSIMQHKFELLCKELSVDICLFLDEIVPSLNKDMKTKVHMLSNALCVGQKEYQCCLSATSKIWSQLFMRNDNEFNFNYNMIKLSSDEVASYHVIPKFYFINERYFSQSNVDLGYNYQPLKRGLHSNSKINFLYKECDVYHQIIQPTISMQYAQPYLGLININGSHLIKNTTLPVQWLLDSVYKNIAQDSVYKNIAQTLLKKSQYKIWQTKEIIFSVILFNQSKVDKILLTRNDVLRICRNATHIHRKGNGDLHKLNKKLISLFENKCMISFNKLLLTSILSIAYEVEYSWNHYISPLLVNKIL